MLVHHTALETGSRQVHMHKVALASLGDAKTEGDSVQVAIKATTAHVPGQEVWQPLVAVTVHPAATAVVSESTAGTQRMW